MAITFKNLPKARFDIDTGTLSGVPSSPQPAHVGISAPELHKQTIDLINNKIPLEKALMAVERHPDITDKEKAKLMVSAVYKIIESSKSKNRS